VDLARKVYMDHTASRPIDPKVFEAMTPYFKEFYGNPSSLHSFGLDAKKALEESRAKIARLIGAENPEEIRFTSGGTESNNLAIKGVAYRNRKRGNHIITTTIEHMSVMNTCKYLARQGFEITYVPVDNQGVVDVEKLEDAIKENTILISVTYASGEIGTIEPIREIGKIASDNEVYLHVDAVAAAGKISINVEDGHVWT
jgi:cysteine desulfurase